jgi:rfaE bifunctional protein kinase chain/domain
MVICNHSSVITDLSLDLLHALAGKTYIQKLLQHVYFSLILPVWSPMDNPFRYIETILQAVQERTVSVFGDFCVDAYWELSSGEQEVSIETGLPVNRVRTQRYLLGGAGNVVANLAAMKVGRIRAIGVVGCDPFGERLMAMLSECGADTTGFVVQRDWQTMVYAKPCDRQQEHGRIDFGAFNETSNALQESLLARLEEAAAASDVIILNQQVPAGLCSMELIKKINGVVARHPKKLFIVDSRHRPEQFERVALKLNMAEAAKLLHEDPAQDMTDTRASEFALRIGRLTQKPAFLTRGELGLAVAVTDQATLIPGLQVLEQTDTVGAGDAVVAALAASLAGGASPVAAGTLANIAATITVKKLKMAGTASAEEILAAAKEPNYIFHPELAASPRRANFLPGTEFEVIGELPADLKIKHCIFDHDGTLSTLREGWEKIMEPMMMHAILGSHYDSVHETTFARISPQVSDFIDRTTGVQTLVQMRGLVDLVRQCGFVPESDILDEHGYKRIYNTDLLRMVAKRVEKLRNGELQAADFEIKNAHLLLKELHDRGVTLYLASGTDQADVEAEAEAMGYAHYFKGGIFGAVGDITKETKKIVLERIIREHNLSGHEFVTFGDGPVELRETQRRGGFSVGVASDELRRFGLNLAKRRRLISAGANLIIPDYSQLPLLLRMLQFEPVADCLASQFSLQEEA